MESKQTAIEWIELKLNSVKPTDFCSIETIKDWINQAKAMEKEQIINAFLSGDNQQGYYLEPELYYEETYATQLPKE